MTKILIVEDEVNLLKPLAEYLSKEGFEVVAASSLAEAEKQMTAGPALVLLDWMLPDGQGIELLKKWRAQGKTLPVILLTARADLVDKVLGLELGANDYLTKPFEPRELVARIRVQLRQIANSSASESNSERIEGQGIVIDLSKREVTYQSKVLEMTKTEFDLLRLFLENRNKVFSREELLKQVWGYEKSPTTRTVDTHILQLRQKTDSSLFETMHGIGYRFRGKK